MTTQVLVFESDATFAQELEVGLAEYDCQTKVVDDANAGLQSAAADKPDLILLSIELPRMNGFSVCNKLKRDSNLKDVPLIIMSSDSTEETFEQHRRLRTRAEDYVHKPISVGDLVTHIQELLPLQSSAEGDESIIIDDDIEIEDADGLEEIDDDVEIEDAELSAPNREAPVDQEVDDFTEQAFGALMGGDPEPQVVEAEPVASVNPGELVLDEEDVEIASLSEPPLVEDEAPAEPPVHEVPGQLEPHTGFQASPDDAPAGPLPDAGKTAELEQELSEARDRISELEAVALAKQRADAEVQRLEVEVRELRDKLASGKSGGSAREFLDLREQLNSKDKEILEIRDQLNHREKELLGLRDGALGLERQKADLDDKVVELERKVYDLNRTNEAFKDDKEQASKRADDFKRKSEKLKTELDAKTQEVAELARQHEEALIAEQVAKAALIEEQQQELGKLADELQAAHNASLEEAKAAARQEGVETATREAEARQSEALRELEARLKSEHDSKMAALHRANEESRSKLRAEQEQATKEAAEAFAKQLAEREAELRTEYEARLSELGQQKEAGEASRDAEIASLQGELSARTEERDRAQATAAEREQKVSALESELAELTSQRDAEQATVAEQRQRIEALDSALTEQNAEFTEQAAKLQEREASIAALEADLSATRQNLSEANQALEAEKGKMDRARQKWTDDRASMERAKDALAAALAQLEETETRQLD